jgi:hypothetical protein
VIGNVLDQKVETRMEVTVVVGSPIPPDCTGAYSPGPDPPTVAAAPLPAEGHGMRTGTAQCEATIPAESKIGLTEALERLVQLYDAWGRKDTADAWRKTLAETKVTARSPANP